MTQPGHTIVAEGLTKLYGDTRALDGFDLTVPRGMVYGLLGPNGAGKTTAVRILATLLRFDAGTALVAGLDVRKNARAVRRRIGLTGQYTAVDDTLTARENLVLFGRLFHVSRADARRRADELLEQFGLADVGGKAPKGFSGGMRRRLDLAASMILAPQVLFLDEPTTGLDPAGRREVWEAVNNMAAGGTTVLLTTHYLDEADRLCDRIAVIDNGRKITDDTPQGLKRAMGSDRLEVVASDPADLSLVAGVVEKAAVDGEVTVDEAELSVSAAVSAGVDALTEVTATLREQSITVADVGLRRPTLDEAFLHLTARSGKENAPA